MPLLNFRLSRPAALVDLNRVAGLAYIHEAAGHVRLGAMTRQRAIEFSPVVRRRLPLLAEATALVGHLPIRSRGTIGGSLAHADPAAEYPTVLTALGGQVIVRGPRGERTLEAGELFDVPRAERHSVEFPTERHCADTCARSHNVSFVVFQRLSGHSCTA